MIAMETAESTPGTLGQPGFVAMVVVPRRQEIIEGVDGKEMKVPGWTSSPLMKTGTHSLPSH